MAKSTRTSRAAAAKAAAPAKEGLNMDQLLALRPDVAAMAKNNNMGTLDTNAVTNWWNKVGAKEMGGYNFTPPTQLSLDDQLAAINSKVSKESGATADEIAGQQKIDALSTASADEQAANAQLGTIDASGQMGIMAAQDTSKNPIPMGLITGQQANISANANLMSQPLKTRLAALQAQRQTSLDASKSSLTALQAQRQSALDADKTSLGALQKQYDMRGQAEIAGMKAKEAEKVAGINAQAKVKVADTGASAKTSTANINQSGASSRSAAKIAADAKAAAKKAANAIKLKKTPAPAKASALDSLKNLIGG